MAINHDEGIYTLDHVYDSQFKTTLQPGKETIIIDRFPGKSSEPKHLWPSHQSRWHKLKSVSKILDLSPKIFIYWIKVFIVENDTAPCFTVRFVIVIHTRGNHSSVSCCHLVGIPSLFDSRMLHDNLYIYPEKTTWKWSNCFKIGKTVISTRNIHVAAPQYPQI